MTSIGQLRGQLTSPGAAAADAAGALELVLRACRSRAQPGTRLFPAYTAAAGATAAALRTLRDAGPWAAPAGALADVPPEAGPADLAALADAAAACLGASADRAPGPRAASCRSAAQGAATARDLLGPGTRLPG